jgi:hypothetical protein
MSANQRAAVSVSDATYPPYPQPLRSRRQDENASKTGGKSIKNNGQPVASEALAQLRIQPKTQFKIRGIEVAMNSRLPIDERRRRLEGVNRLYCASYVSDQCGMGAIADANASAAAVTFQLWIIDNRAQREQILLIAMRT